MKVFYSSDGCAFFVAGYDQTQDRVTDAISNLRNNAEKAATAFNVAQKEVYSYIVSTSRQYRGMRVFFADCPLPKGAFETGLTMTDFVES